MKKKKQEDFNSFDRTVEMMMPQADCIFLSHFDGYGVIGEPCNSKTGQTWALAILSSIKEAVKCKYPIACDPKDRKLVAYLNKYRSNKSRKVQ